MPERDMGRGVHAVGAVLAAAVMAPADLLLPGEPSGIMRGVAGVEDPLAETLAHGGEIGADRLAGAVLAEGGEQVRLRGDEAVPDIEDRLDPVGDDRAGLPQRRDVVRAEQQARFELGELARGQGRGRRAGSP